MFRVGARGDTEETRIRQKNTPAALERVNEKATWTPPELSRDIQREIYEGDVEEEQGGD